MKGKDEIKYKIKGALVEYADGTIEKTKMFDILELPLDDYSDLEFTETEIKRLRMHIMKMRTGVQAMAPLLCAGPVKCIFRERCPLVDKSIKTEDGNIDYHNQNVKLFPLARQCIIERDFMEFKRRQYIEEYDVDITSPTDMAMVNKLAELDLYEYRTTLILAHGDRDGDGQDLLKKQTVSGDKKGNPLKKTEIHPVWELKEKIHKMRLEILEAMVGTRKEQYKRAAALKNSDNQDPASVAAELREKLEQLQRQGFADEDTIDVEFTEK